MKEMHFTHFLQNKVKHIFVHIPIILDNPLKLVFRIRKRYYTFIVKQSKTYIFLSNLV